MPGTEMSEALSRVLQPKLKNFVVIFSSYPLTKVITYQGIAFWKNTHYNPIFDS